MQSCDTFALRGSHYESGRNLLAKNSDRPLGECQILVKIPGARHAAGEMVRCTHISIPQVQTTYTVLGSRPYWIWGFEMGFNEWGLVIGNEAQGSRCEAEADPTERMAAAANALMELSEKLFLDIQSVLRASGGLYGIRKEFLEDYCNQTGMQLD